MQLVAGRSDARDAARSAAGAERGDARFLLENAAGQLVLRTAGLAVEQVLASHAQNSLYDERLELVWYEDGQRLWVLDLRKLASAPVLIAEHVPEHAELHVARQADRLLEPADGCDTVPVLRLNWSGTPAFEAWYATAPALSAQGSAWLVAQLGRTARSLPAPQTFTEQRVDSTWAGDKGQCEAPFVCGSSLPFTGGATQLVLTSARTGGDCWHFQCVLRDPHEAVFRTPPDASNSGAASQGEPGSCGPYRFHRDGSAFLVDERVCLSGAACEALGGRAVGWLEPGVTVGAPE